MKTLKDILAMEALRDQHLKVQNNGQYEVWDDENLKYWKKTDLKKNHLSPQGWGVWEEEDHGVNKGHASVEDGEKKVKGEGGDDFGNSYMGEGLHSRARNESSDDSHEKASKNLQEVSLESQRGHEAMMREEISRSSLLPTSVEIFSKTFEADVNAAEPPQWGGVEDDGRGVEGVKGMRKEKKKVRKVREVENKRAERFFEIEARKQAKVPQIFKFRQGRQGSESRLRAKLNKGRNIPGHANRGSAHRKLISSQPIFQNNKVLANRKQMLRTMNDQFRTKVVGDQRLKAHMDATSDVWESDFSDYWEETGLKRDRPSPQDWGRKEKKEHNVIKRPASVAEHEGGVESEDVALFKDDYFEKWDAQSLSDSSYGKGLKNHWGGPVSGGGFRGALGNKSGKKPRNVKDRNRKVLMENKYEKTKHNGKISFGINLDHLNEKALEKSDQNHNNRIKQFNRNTHNNNNKNNNRNHNNNNRNNNPNNNQRFNNNKMSNNNNRFNHNKDSHAEFNQLSNQVSGADSSHMYYKEDYYKDYDFVAPKPRDYPIKPKAGEFSHGFDSRQKFGAIKKNTGGFSDYKNYYDTEEYGLKSQHPSKHPLGNSHHLGLEEGGVDETEAPSLVVSSDTIKDLAPAKVESSDARELTPLPANQTGLKTLLIENKC